MRRKRVMLILLAVSIIFNIFAFNYARKYKSAVEDNMQNMLNHMFADADSINNDLEKISANGEATSEQLTTIENNYEKLIYNIQNIREIAGNVDGHSGERVGSFNYYYQCMSDFDRFSSELKKESKSSKITLTKDELDYMKRFKKFLYAVDKVRNNNSYFKDNMMHLKMDQWMKIVKELSGVDIFQ